jgi:hypothetical protein
MTKLSEHTGLSDLEASRFIRWLGGNEAAEVPVTRKQVTTRTEATKKPATPAHEKREPTWAREARERKIAKLVFFYNKGDGLAYIPSEPGTPIGVGGDYDGMYSASPLTAYQLTEIRYQNGQLEPCAVCFMPYLHKLIAGEDFSLDDVIRDCNPRIVGVGR